MRILIFANGIFSDSLPGSIHPHPEDIVIAADGGARHCRQLGIIPHVAIGDFDSLNKIDVIEMVNNGTKMIRFPSRKDSTDLELAIQYASDLGGSEILIYGALGLRWDQTLANLLLLARTDSSSQVRLIDGAQEIMLVRPPQTVKIHGQRGDTVSLIPISGNAQGVTASGLEYPLQDETLYFGATRGISNVLLEKTATLSLSSGMLICVVIHTANL